MSFAVNYKYLPSFDYFSIGLSFERKKGTGYFFSSSFLFFGPPIGVEGRLPLGLSPVLEILNRGVEPNPNLCVILICHSVCP
jgi:hypothetical protein